MLGLLARYIVATGTAIVLLTSCAAESSTPAAPLAGTNRVAAAKLVKRCPCLYVTIPYSAKFPSGAVAVYRSGATGHARPLQYIAGGKTGLSTPSDIAVDSDGNMYVANFHGINSDRVTVYASGATGNVAPIRTIAGPHTGLAKPFGIALNPVNGDIYVTNRQGGSSLVGSITIYSSGSSGNVAPIRTIEGPATGLNNPGSLVLDASGNIYVPNIKANSITVYNAGSAGNAAPTTTISGSHTQLHQPFQLTLDSSLNIYTANFSTPTSLTIYAAGATGNATPMRMIAGTKTKLDGPDGIALDAGANIYAAEYDSNRITVYAPTANGNAGPMWSIKGERTGIICPSGIVIR